MVPVASGSSTGQCSAGLSEDSPRIPLSRHVTSRHATPGHLHPFALPEVRGDLLREQRGNRIPLLTSTLTLAFHHCIPPARLGGNSRLPPLTVWRGDSKRGVISCRGTSVVTICSIFRSPDVLALPLTVLWVHGPQLPMFRERGFSFNTKLSKP